MIPKALQASAAVAFVVFSVFAILLCITVNRNTTISDSADYGSGYRSVKPMLVGIGTN